jgi:hypothetical protein
MGWRRVCCMGGARSCVGATEECRRVFTLSLRCRIAKSFPFSLSLRVYWIMRTVLYVRRAYN